MVRFFTANALIAERPRRHHGVLSRSPLIPPARAHRVHIAHLSCVYIKQTVRLLNLTSVEGWTVVTTQGTFPVATRNARLRLSTERRNGISLRFHGHCRAHRSWQLDRSSRALRVSCTLTGSSVPCSVRYPQGPLSTSPSGPSLSPYY